MYQVIISIFVSLFILSSCASNKFENKWDIDHVYVVNLDRTPERYSEIKKNLEEAGIEHERFSASDGYKLAFKDNKTGKAYDGKSLWNYCKPIKDKNPDHEFSFGCSCAGKNSVNFNICYTPGEMGVYCSMKRIWQDVLDKNYKMALILEDDSRVQPEYMKNFKFKVQEIIDSTPEDWDVIFLHMYFGYIKVYPARLRGTKLENHLVWGINRDPKYYISSCAAYIIRRSFAERMTMFASSAKLPIDLVIADAINKKIINGYYSKKKMILPDEKEVNSVIKLMGRNEAGVMN